MRNLVLLLVLVNLGVLAMFSWFVDGPAAPAPWDGPGITLLRETDPDALSELPAGLPDTSVVTASDSVAGDDSVAEADGQAQELSPLAGAADQAPDEPEVAGILRCLSIGPFAETDDADEAMATLTDAGFEPVLNTRQAEIWEGYWVYIERLEDQAEARAITADLADNGIDDTLIIASSDSGILISLGVFSEIARAGNQAERVNRLGYEATIADSMRTTDTFWLDVMLTSEESIVIEQLQAPGTISRLEQLACPDESL